MVRKALFCAVLLGVSLVAFSAPMEASDPEPHPASDELVCTEEPTTCGGDPLDSLFSAQTGPGDGCCSRHLEMAETLCQCGVKEFHCFSTSTGGCSSWWRCEICPA